MCTIQVLFDLVIMCIARDQIHQNTRIITWYRGVNNKTPPHDKSPTVIFWRLFENNKPPPRLFRAKRAKFFGHFGLLMGISLLNSASFENNKTHPPLFQIPKLKKEIPHSKISRIWTLKGFCQTY